MIITNKKLKNYALAATGVVMLLSLYFSLFSKKVTEDTNTTAEYSQTTVQEQLDQNFLNGTIGKSLEEIENTNSGLTEINRITTARGYIITSFRDADKKPFEVYSNSAGYVTATVRPTSAEYEKRVTTLKEYLDLGEPEGIVYPINASLAEVHVYPEEGIAIYFEGGSGIVEYIITFENMTLGEFTRVFETKFQDTRNPKAY